MALEFTLNGEPISLDVDPDMPLLWAIRDLAGLTGTKAQEKPQNHSEGIWHRDVPTAEGRERAKIAIFA